VVARTIEKAIVELERGDGGASARTVALRRELGTVEAQLGRLTQAIVLGGPIERLVAELQQLEARKAALVSELGSAARLGDRLTLARADLEGPVEAAVRDYRGVLSRQTAEARAILRELLVDRVLYAPAPSRDGRRWYQFTAQRSLGRILRGALDLNGGGPNGK
jgi:hypothetical protein